MARISEDQVFEYYAGGLPEDFSIDYNKVNRPKVDMNASTVQISLKIEHALLFRLKQEAEKKGLPYQTFMKQLLKAALNEQTYREELQQIKASLERIEKSMSRAS